MPSETCKECGRPVSSSMWCDIHECFPGEVACNVIAAAYRRGRLAGMDEGVEVAKEHAYPDIIDLCECVNWTDVDAEIARRKGER